MKKILEITKVVFDNLQLEIKRLNIDSDRKSFDEIKYILNNEVIFNSEDFAFECFYVVCVAGFKQDYAKVLCNKIIDFINKSPIFEVDDLLKIYKNKNKCNAIQKIWNSRVEYRNKFYNLSDINEKIEFLGTLPYIGNITKYHLARNLGLDFVKYDIWIQRLGVALYGNREYYDKIDNKKLLPEIKYFCDLMFGKLNEITGEKVGFIDVVLWRACQKGLLKIDGGEVFIAFDNFFVDGIDL
jgi:hypothetical protein